MLPQDRSIHFRSDGLALSPAEYARLLAQIAEGEGIAADEFSLGGAVERLERRMAELLGKEVAVFMPSGTLANHLALRLLSQRGRRVLVQRESHIYCDCGDCVQELSGLTLVPLAAGRTSFTLDDVMTEAGREDEGRVRTPIGAISIKSPVRRRRGEVFDHAEMQRITGFAREHGIGLHLDGARLFLAAPYTDIAPSIYAAPFDTVYVSLYKYFNAAGGAILAGSRQLLDGLYHQRRMFGGGLRQAWPYAAVASHYLEGFAGRFAEAAAMADRLFGALGEHPPGGGTALGGFDQRHPPAAARRRRGGATGTARRARDIDPPGARRLYRCRRVRADPERNDPAPAAGADDRRFRQRDRRRMTTGSRGLAALRLTLAEPALI